MTELHGLNTRGHSLPFMVSAAVATMSIAITHAFVVLELAPPTALSYLAGSMAGAVLGLFGGASYVINRPTAFTK